MMGNVAELIEFGGIFSFYTNNRLIILSLLMIVSIIGGLVVLLAAKQSVNRQVWPRMFGIPIVYVICVVCVGNVIRLLGFELTFAIEFVPFITFILFCVVLLFIWLFDCIKFYKSFIKATKNSCKYAELAIYLEVLILSNMRRLDFLEMGTATAVVIIIHIFRNCQTNVLAVQNIASIDKDIPIEREEDLFPSRTRQLHSFCHEIEGELSRLEPYAIMLSGEWGGGKTSFINSFKSRMNNCEFILIEAGFEIDIVKMLDNIAKQLGMIFEKNGIIMGSHSSVDKYFADVASMVGNFSNDNAVSIIRSMIYPSEGYVDNKSELNEELMRLYQVAKKHVIIIVDNLDRCKDNVREKMFEVIRESVYLQNCKTLFLIDEMQFVTDHLNQQYLEKYIGKIIYICNVEFEEIVGSYICEFLTDRFLEDKSSYITQNSTMLRNEITKKTINMLRALQEKHEELVNSLSDSKLDQRSKETNKEKAESLKGKIETIISGMKNPRKVKRYLFSGVQDMLRLADIIWFSDADASKNYYSSCDWIKIILAISFLKSFLTKEYADILRFSGIDEYIKESDATIEYCLIDGLSTFGKGREASLFGLILFKLHALDSKIDKEVHQRLTEELNENRLKEENIDDYIIMSLDINPNERVAKIIDYISNNEFKNKSRKAELLLDLTKHIFSRVQYEDLHDIEVQKMLKQIIVKESATGLFSSSDQNSFERELNNLEIRLIWGKMSLFRIFLSLMYEEKIVNSFFSDDIQTIDSLFVSLNKLNALKEIYLLSEGKNKIIEIENYFNKAYALLQKDQYARIHDVIDEYMRCIMNILACLKLWFSEKNEPIYQRSNRIWDYFDFDEILVFSETLSSVGAFTEALSLLERYSCENPNCKNGAALFLFRKCVESATSKDKDWFEGQEVGVMEKLERLYDFIEKHNVVQVRYNLLHWKFIKLLMFKLRNKIVGN